MKTLGLIVAALVVIQMFIAGVIAHFNGKHFHNRKGSEYAQAVAELSREKPGAATIIKICWVACFIEVAALFIYKHLG
jgi:hypothetical protein